MKKYLRIIAAVFGMILAAAGTIDRAALAEKIVDNTGQYRIILDDDADLLSPEEEERLLETMRSLSQYGHVVFWTFDRSDNDSLLVLQQYVDQNVSASVNEPSISFAINIGKHKMELLTRGNIQANVDSSEANTITDRHSGLATRGEYGECAAAVFSDVYNAIHGIYEFPVMRVICSILLALGIALLAIFLYTQRTSLLPAGTVNTTLTINRGHSTKASITEDRIIRTSKVRVSSESGSSCSSCSSGSSCSSCSSGSSCSSCGSGGGSSF